MIRTRKGSEPGSGTGSEEIPTDVSAFRNDVPYLTASSMMSTEPAQLAMTAVQPAQLNALALSIPPAQQPSDWAATSGVARVLNKPAIPAAQVQSDWAAVSGPASILNKPSMPAAQVQPDWNATLGLGAILNKPALPAAQVQSDWNATSGLGVILNKPAAYSPQPPVANASPAVNTAYQHADKTKPFKAIVNVRSAITVTLLALSAADRVELRVAPTAAGALAGGAGGFSLGVWETGITGISVAVGMGLTDGGQMTADIPAGWYYSINRLNGTTATIVSCLTQSLAV